MSKKAKKFAVVAFPLEENAMAVVPMKWLIQGRSKKSFTCMWPPRLSAAQMKKLVMAERDPDKKWNWYPATVLHQAKSYEKALKTMRAYQCKKNLGNSFNNEDDLETSGSQDESRSVSGEDEEMPSMEIEKVPSIRAEKKTSKRHIVVIEPSSMKQIAAEPPFMQRITAEPSSMQRTTVEPSSMQRTTVEPSSMQRTTVEPSSMQQTVVDITCVKIEDSDDETEDALRAQQNQSNLEISFNHQPTRTQSKSRSVSNGIEKVFAIRAENRSSSLQQTAAEQSSMQRISIDPSSIRQIAVEPSFMQQIAVEPSFIQRIAVEPSSMQQIALEPSSIQQRIAQSSSMQRIVLEPSSMQQRIVEPSPIQQTVVDINCVSCARMEKQMISLENKLDTMVKITSDLNRDLQLVMKMITANNNSSNDLMPQFKQVKSIEELVQLNEDLIDEELFTKMTEFLGSYGGKDKHAATRKVMSVLINNDLAMKMNWMGGVKKRSIQEFKLVIKLVAAAVRHNKIYAETTLSEVESWIARWLRYASDRDGVNKKRRVVTCDVE